MDRFVIRKSIGDGKGSSTAEKPQKPEGFRCFQCQREFKDKQGLGGACSPTRNSNSEFSEANPWRKP